MENAYRAYCTEMGLFSFVGKALATVARGVASKLTGGLSEQALKLLKGRNAAKQAAQQTEQANIMMKKIGQPTLQVSRTETRQPGEGWNFAVRQGKTGKARRAKGKGKKAGWVWAGSCEVGEDGERTGRGWFNASGDFDPTAPGEYRYTSECQNTGEYRVPKRKRARSLAKPRSNGKRTVPPGGLDLKAISALWKQQGKPGTWQAFIKANSHVRKK